MDYEQKNLTQTKSEVDSFTLERYSQFYNYFPKGQHVLDVGCNTGRGGERLNQLNNSLKIHGIDVVEKRLDQLPDCYTDVTKGSCHALTMPDKTFDIIVAGEIIEHIMPGHVDQALCEFHRVLKIGGRLLMTTPNPHDIKTRKTVLGVSHVSQHYPKILKHRLLTHGFSRIKIRGSGKVTRYLGDKFPFLNIYGSYLIMADKF